MAKRSYNQHCALARALDIIGERWSLLLVRELLTGPKRFKDLLDGLPSMGTNLLSARLKELEAAGVILKGDLPPPAGATVYRLSALGQTLEPAVLELVKWGFRFLGLKKPKEISRPHWDLVAMKAAFLPDKAKGVKADYELKVDGTLFAIRVDDGRLDIDLGPASDPVARLATYGAVLSRLGMGQLDPRDAIASGAVRVEGNKKEALRMFRLFRATP